MKKKKVLQKKVWLSLLALAFVHLGGNNSFIAPELVYAAEYSTTISADQKFEDGDIVKVDNAYAVKADNSKIAITANGTLNISSKNTDDQMWESSTSGSVFVTNSGELSVTGDVVNITSTNEDYGISISASDGANVTFNNKELNITASAENQYRIIGILVDNNPAKNTPPESVKAAKFTFGGENLNIDVTATTAKGEGKQFDDAGSYGIEVGYLGNADIGNESTKNIIIKADTLGIRLEDANVVNFNGDLLQSQGAASADNGFYNNPLYGDRINTLQGFGAGVYAYDVATTVNFNSKRTELSGVTGFMTESQDKKVRPTTNFRGEAHLTGVSGAYGQGDGASIEYSDVNFYEDAYLSGTQYNDARDPDSNDAVGKGLFAEQESNVYFAKNLYAEGFTKNYSSRGVQSYNSRITVDGNAVLVAKSDTNSAYGIDSWGSTSNITIKGDTQIALATNSTTAVNVGVLAWGGGQVNLEKSVVIQGKESDYALWTSTGGGAINVNQNGAGVVQMNGYVKAQDGGTINTKLVGENSYLKGMLWAVGGSINMDLDGATFDGWSMKESNGKIAINLSNNAQWRVNVNSEVNALKLESGSVVDLTHGTTTWVATDNLSGNGGGFLLDTDLASQKADLVYVFGAEQGSSAYLQVKDASLINHQVVPGGKKVILATDYSKNVEFVAKEFDTGGIWDVIPTLEKELSTNGNTQDWYLTNIEKKINKDTNVILKDSQNNYAFWRVNNDSLRPRFNELRGGRDIVGGNENENWGGRGKTPLNVMETSGKVAHDAQASGIWARSGFGRFGGNGFDSSMSFYQLGFDKEYNSKSLYGVAVDNGTGHSSYANGSGKDKFTAFNMYGTWYGDTGAYTNVVGRYGMFRSDIDSFGNFPDSGDYKNRAYSLSAEYGKTIVLKKGVYIEPQVQVIAGRMSNSDYTTKRGKRVEMDSMNSLIGRAGFVVGEKNDEGNDVYFKMSALHEFAGKRDMTVVAADGNKLVQSDDYGDSWYEIGIGTNIKIGNNSRFYGDIERSFGGDISKKWQVNAGLRFEF